MAATAVEAIDHFIKARGFREGETFLFASLQIRYPHQDELRAVLKQMGEDGVIENASEDSYKMTMAGYVKFFGSPPSEDDTIKAIMTEIGTRGIKIGKSFIWAPVQESLVLKRFRDGDLKPALEKILTNRWLENASMPGFYRLTDAGFSALDSGNAE